MRTEPPAALLHSRRTRVAHLELTSRCNLRCVYCAVSQPTYQGVDLDLGRFDELVETLAERQVELVWVNGHGETTMIDGWDALCRRLLARGFKLAIVTNLSRPLEEAEIETLSRFDQVCVSCDTIDPELFTRLRRKAKLSVLLEGQAQILDRAKRSGRSGPRISWSCVVSDQNVVGLAELVRKGIDSGVRHFELCNLTQYPDLPDALKVAHIGTLDLESMRRARVALRDAARLAEENGCSYSIQAGLLDVLEHRIQALSANAAPAAAADPPNAESAPKRTRLCLDPWSMLYVQADGAVRTCCWKFDPLGRLGKGDSLAAIANGPELRRLRGQLLSGELAPACEACPARHWGTLAQQERAVLRVLASQGALRGALLWRHRRNQALRAVASPLRRALRSLRPDN